MARWNPVVFSRCRCEAGCPTTTRFEPLGRTAAAVHVAVHHRAVPARRVIVPSSAPTGPGALPFLLIGAAAFLLAAFEARGR
jgi:hypothetical protein